MSFDGSSLSVLKVKEKYQFRQGKYICVVIVTDLTDISWGSEWSENDLRTQLGVVGSVE